MTLTNAKKKPNIRQFRNSLVASNMASDEMSNRISEGAAAWVSPKRTTANINKKAQPCIITGPTSLNLPSPLRRAIIICEPVLKPKAIVKTQM